LQYCDYKKEQQRPKFPCTDPGIAGHTIYMDLLPTFSRQGLTPATPFACCLTMVDKTSRKPQVCGLKDCTSESIIHSVNEFTAPCNHPVSVEHVNVNVRKIKNDTGTQFTSSNFSEACAAADIELSIAAPKHKEQNHNVERTWYSLQTIADAMLVHARLPPKFT
jgi:hypothetical protein